MAKVTLKAVAFAPAPVLNELYVSAVPGDNVCIQGGVQLNLAPGAILDPLQLGVSGPNQVPTITPGVFSEEMSGYYAGILPTTGGLGGYKLKYYAPGGAEIAAGAYPAQITGGLLVLCILYAQ
jgi:hypothetical protein